MRMPLTPCFVAIAALCLTAQSAPCAPSAREAADTWHAPHVFLEKVPYSVAPSLALDDEGNGLILWTSSTGGKETLFFSTRKMQESAWKVPEALYTLKDGESRCPDPLTGFDANGNAWGLWRVNTGGLSTVYASRYTGSDGAWSSPQYLSGIHPQASYWPKMVLKTVPDGTALAMVHATRESKSPEETPETGPKRPPKRCSHVRLLALNPMTPLKVNDMGNYDWQTRCFFDISAGGEALFAHSRFGVASSSACKPGGEWAKAGDSTANFRGLAWDAASGFTLLGACAGQDKTKKLATWSYNHKGWQGPFDTPATNENVDGFQVDDLGRMRLVWADYNEKHPKAFSACFTPGQGWGPVQSLAATFPYRKFFSNRAGHALLVEEDNTCRFAAPGEGWSEPQTLPFLDANTKVINAAINRNGDISLLLETKQSDPYSYSYSVMESY